MHAIGNYEKSRSSEWYLRLAAVGALMAVAFVMLDISWGKWPDILIDFGRELYVPWRLSEGDVLYRDILYFNGPFSPYWNALWFVLFGPGLDTIVYVNIILLAVIVIMLFVLLRSVSAGFPAWFACMVFLLMFAFNQYIGIGNYNYICPYSHEVAHGMLFSLFGLWAGTQFTKTQRRRFLSLSGISIGVVFLTKPEFFIAVAVASGVPLILWSWRMRLSLRTAVVNFSLYAVSLLLPPLIALVLLVKPLGVHDALIRVIGAWQYLGCPEITTLPFYKFGMGLDRPLANAVKMIAVSTVYFLLFLPGVFFSPVAKHKMRTYGASVVAAGALLALAYVYRQQIPWYDAARALPVFILITAVCLFWTVMKQKDLSLLPHLSLTLFALVLMAKILLYARFFHYGFVLSMPAMMVFVVLCVHWIPGLLRRKGKSPLLFQVMAVTVFCIIAVYHVDLSSRRYKNKTVAVGAGRDLFYADNRGVRVNEILKWLKKHTDRGHTLTVLPEGIMLNYLCRKVNPTTSVNLMPPEMLMFGEKKLLQKIKNNPPDFISIVHRNTSEYGYPFFGRDYGASIFDWLRQHYQTRFVSGHPPLQDHRFGILIASRLPRAGSSP